MDRGWLPAVTSAAALIVYGFAGEGVPRPYILRRIESRMQGLMEGRMEDRMEGINRVLPV